MEQKIYKLTSISVGSHLIRRLLSPFATIPTHLSICPQSSIRFTFNLLIMFKLFVKVCVIF